MRVTVHYLAQIKRAAGCATEDFDATEGASLGETLRALAQRHGEGFRAMLLDEASEPRKSLLFFVGDEHVNLTHSLQEGDVITILAPMAGG